MFLRMFLASCLMLVASFSQDRRVVAAISHRGEHLQHPENTMPAFEAAILAGVDFVEADVTA